MSTRKEENNSYGSSVLDSLGSYYNSAKDTFWGKDVPIMNKGAVGFYDTNFFSPEQWQQFGSKGGTIGDNGQLYNADGSAFDVGSIGGNTKGLGSTTEGGLGGLISNETLSKAGNIAGNLGQVFGMYQSINDIFGSGAKSKKAAEKRLEEGFKQNYAMNQMSMNKFKEDNDHFKKQRSDITSSYNATT